MHLSLRASLTLCASAVFFLCFFAGCGSSAPTQPFVIGSSLSFSTIAGYNSSTQSVTLANVSNTRAAVGAFSISGANAGNFTLANGCGYTLEPGGSCSLSVTFSAATAGNYSATLSVASSSPMAGSVSTQLSGTAAAGTPAASLSGSLVFGTLTAGSTSPEKILSLTNTGTAPLVISSVALSGSGSNLFPLANYCTGSLAPGASCGIHATFAPRVAGSYAATLTIADNVSTGTQAVAVSGTAAPAQITIDTTTATDWKISNGTLSIDFNSLSGHIYGMHLAGLADQLVDTTTVSGGFPQGFYMDNSGFGTPTPTASYSLTSNYLDWWVTYPSSSTNAYTYSEHFIMTPNDPGFHVYFVANHAATDIAGSIGQVQWVFRENLNDFTNTYSVDPSVNNPGPTIVPLPPANENFSTDVGRQVQDATVDLHGLAVPAGFTRNFYTKYDYSSYNYLHKAHGVYGSNVGVWAVLPSNESKVGGPTKQNLIFTGNLLIIEAYSNHYDNPLTLATPSGTASQRLFGPFYVHFNQPGQPAYTATGNTLNTPADLYGDALATANTFNSLYDNEAQLATSGYVPSSARGTVQVQVNNATGNAKSTWAVLSDPAKNFQFSSSGAQYWADISTTGAATFSGVIPGTYRLSVYQLGNFGELRVDGVTVKAGGVTTVPTQTFVPENFGTTVWAIGTPDRSSHEFLHGHDNKGFDDREFWGTWNYWADFAATSGSVVYNATAGPAGPATNDLTKWNYNHWGTFDPGLFGGVYSSTDDTTDGYKYAIPSYVAGLPGASGTNGVTTRLPNWTVHFATPANLGTAQYVVLSVALACDYGSYVATLNGAARTWGYRATVESDCSVRSGLSGYTQWIALQWPVSALTASGMDNVLTLGVSQTYGAMDDALRLELSTTGAAPSLTGFNDYEYVGTSSTSQNIQANDAVPNP